MSDESKKRFAAIRDIPGAYDQVLDEVDAGGGLEDEASENALTDRLYRRFIDEDNDLGDARIVDRFEREFVPEQIRGKFRDKISMTLAARNEAQNLMKEKEDN